MYGLFNSRGCILNQEPLHTHASACHVPWKVGAVVGVDDEIVLSVEEAASN